eukprot:2912513-Rhodomonas_salina.1
MPGTETRCHATTGPAEAEGGRARTGGTHSTVLRTRYLMPASDWSYCPITRFLLSYLALVSGPERGCGGS